jgi:outer membrane protein assembly factor BamD
MRRVVNILIICLLCLSSCSTFDKVYKSADISGRYEAAKGYYLEGQYLKASQLLESMITLLKGSDKAEESLIMLARCYYNSGDYETASQYFRVYYSNYPRGEFAEYARFYSGKSLYEGIAEPELDQSGTHQAISELQLFMEYFPYSEYREESEAMILRMHELLVEKEFLSAKLYYELGDYMAYMGNNYQACIITAQNVLNDYPYTSMREEISMLILRARYKMAHNSVEEKKEERYRATVDEYYAFKTEFPDSEHLKEAEKFYKEAAKFLKID